MGLGAGTVAVLAVTFLHLPYGNLPHHNIQLPLPARSQVLSSSRMTIKLVARVVRATAAALAVAGTTAAIG